MKKTWKRMVLLLMAALWMFCVTASAEGASGDNSLYSLGLENASSCSPEFYYSTLEYNVTVPAGTTELYLSPVTSDAYATILDISGTTLDESGNGTVYITVEAPNGAQVSYVLNVTSDGAVAETESETEDAAAAEQARLEEEQRKAAESEEAARQEAERKANEEKLTKLTSENSQLTERMDVLLKVLYGLVAFAVILLFLIINQSLRNKDLKDDLKEARNQADMNNEFARKEQNMRTDYYYAPVNGRNQNPVIPGSMQQMSDDSSNTQAVFGNAPQRLQSQPMAGQAYAAPQDAAQAGIPENPAGMPVAGTVPTVPEVPQPQPQNLSRREQKRMEKAAKKAEKTNQPEGQPVPAPGQVPETLVQSTVEEPDVNVDMIDL